MTIKAAMSSQSVRSVLRADIPFMQKHMRSHARFLIGAVARQDLAEVRRWMRLARQRCRTRRQLLRLSDEALRDIGVSRQQAELEACKPFWK